MKTKNQNKKNEADLINELKMAQRVGTKSLSERAEVLTAQSNFKRNGLWAWNERNRPGNNKTLNR